MASIAAIIDNLKEARRYARSDVGSAIILIDFARNGLHNTKFWDFTVTPSRLELNLSIAKRYIQVAPDVAIGYIDGAAFELELYLGKPKEDES